MTSGDVLSFLVTALPNAAGLILGFLSAWYLFVLQENRKQSFAAQSVRQSLIAELKWLESHLSMIVIKCAVQSDIMPDGVREFRWFSKAGVQRNILEELPPGTLESIDKTLALRDEEIAKLIRLFKHESHSAELEISITNSVLAAPTSAKLSPEEIKRLIDVKWQISMLARELRSMHESHLLTFTVTDETNMKIVKSNYAGSLRMYGQRANYLLKYVRAALGELEKPGS